MLGRRVYALGWLLVLAGCVDVPAPPATAAVDGAVTNDGRPLDAPPGAACADCPADMRCVAGRCAACEPGSHLGCDPAGMQPICDAESLSCRPCAADECAAGYCLPDGRCAACDPDGSLGCGDPERPYCDDGACRPCMADVECVAAGRSPVCDTGSGVCRPCLDGTGRGCDPTGQSPICEGETCRECRDTAECGAGRLCQDGRCIGCNPADNLGCMPDGPAPICEAGFCVPCSRDGQCLDPQRPECVDGACLPCDPTDHSGCDGDSQQPLCRDGVCVGCGEAGVECATADPERPICRPNGRCRECDWETNEGCDPASTRPLCVAGQCVGCGEAGVECSARDPGRPYCHADGRCGACVPATAEGCDREGAAPACDEVSLACVGCRGDGDCATGYCDPQAEGRCVPCISGTPLGCDFRSETPFCTNAWRCVACSRDVHCEGNLAGPECQINDGVCGCSADEQCAGNPTGIHCHGAGDCGCHQDDQCLPGYGCNRDTEYCEPM